MMGKGNDPNTLGLAPLPVVCAEATACAHRIVASNPRVSVSRAGMLQAELQTRLDLPVLKGRDVLFLHVGGSFAYGLAHDSSDVDIRGVYLADTRRHLGLRPDPDQLEDRPHDLLAYEAGKFVRLALACNPNVMEIMWAPRLLSSAAGDMLLEHRDAFLSQRARTTYGGFAVAQRKQLEKFEPGPKRDKAARHALRVLEQGITLLRTGVPAVANPDPEGLLRRAGLPPDQLAREIDRLDHLLRSVPSVLPDQPDERTANDVLVELRMMQLTGR